MQKKFTPSLLFSAVLTALASVSTFASAAPNHYVDWNGSDIPTINNKYEISSEEADQHANGESWFAVLDVNNDATGTLEDLDLTVNTTGDTSSKQVIAVDVENGDVTFSGQVFNVSVDTGFKGTGNNQATAVLVEAGSKLSITAAETNLDVTSTNIDGKSIYGLAAQGKGTSVTVSSAVTNINLKTNTNRDNSNPVGSITTYSEAPAINASDGGQIHFTQGTELNIVVESTGNALFGKWDDKNTATNQKDWIGNYWGGSPAYGVKLEGGQGTFEGTVNIDVKADGGRAVGVAVTDYFANTTSGQIWDDAAGSFKDLKITADSKAGEAIGVDVNASDLEKNSVILKVSGNTDVTANSESGSVRGLQVSGKTSAEFGGDFVAKVTGGSASGDIRGINVFDGANVNLGQKGSTVSVNLNSEAVDDESIAIGIRAAAHGVLNINADNVVVTGTSNGWIYGVNAQNSTTTDKEDLATLIINANKTVIDVSSTGQASSGIVTMSQGNVEINGDLYVKADDVIVTRGFAQTSINKDKTATVQLEGNVKFDFDENTSKTSVDATVDMNLTGADSYWKGNTLVSWNGNPTSSDLEVKDMTLNMEDGAQWTPSYVENTDSQTYVALNYLNFNDSVINIENGSKQEVVVENMQGTGGTINLTATTSDGKSIEAGSFKADNVSGDVALAVYAQGVTSDEITDPEAALQSLNEKVAVKADKTNTIAEGDVNGALTQTVAADGTASTVQIAENTKLASMKGVNAAALVAWRDEVAYTNQRMEYLRDGGNAYGAWAQVYGGESSYDDGSVDLKTTTVQVGADTAIGDWVAGAAFSYMNGDADMHNGSADTDAYTLSLYASRMFDSGLFVNGLARYGRLSTDATAGNMDGSYDNNAFSIGGNVGYRFTFAEQAFVEPSFGLQYAYVMGDDYMASNGVKVQQDDFDALIASLGARIGFNFAKDAGKIYARASVNHDFMGEIDGTAGNSKAVQDMYVDLGGTWVTYGLGTQFNITDNLSVWGNLDRTTGGEVSTNYMMNAGVRYVF